MDLVSRDKLDAFTSLTLKTGHGEEGKHVHRYDIKERVNVIGRKKSQGLLGFHHFTGADYGGKYVGVSKKRWTDRYLELEENDPIVESFTLLGSLAASQLTLSETGELPAPIQPLERFVCFGYWKEGPQTLPRTRWDLFRTKNLESELLPPTRATLLPHIMRTNYICQASRSYITTNPVLPAMVESGWMICEKENIIKPVLCLYPPAPKGILELVKCACKGSGCGSNCSCKKNNLPCTSLCKCRHEGCTNAEKYATDELQ